MPDLLEQLQEESIQERARGNGDSAGGTVGYSLFHWMAQAGETLPPWWSPDRDWELRRKAKESDHFSGALNMLAAKLAAIPFRIQPRDMSIKAHHRQAEQYSIRLWEGSEFGEGYDAWMSKILLDFWYQDNGFFSEVIGDGKKDGPIVGPALGLAALDAWRCQRTGNPQFPVVYRDTDGKAFKLHRSRVIYRSSLASTMAEMYGVGFCWLSRAINNVQHLVDIATYEQEKLGSRPKRAFLLTGGGLSPNDIASATRLADDSMDGQGMARYSKMVAIGHQAIREPSIELIDLMSVPDGFDKQTSTTLAMYAIALAGGFPPRWIWPATASGATKADAMFSHIAGQGSGVGSILTMLTLLLGGSPQGPRHMIGKFLPPHLKIVYDFQDDEQDRMVAEVKDTRAKTRETNLNTGVYDVRTARENALSDGDMTEQQFARLELEDGRLPDGGDVLQLFSSTENDFIRLLDVGVDEPLAIDINDPADMLVNIEVAALNAQDELQNSTNVKQRSRAEQALAALTKLKELYANILTQQLQAETVEEIEGEAEETEGAEQPDAEQEPAQEPEQEEAIQEEPAEKSFGFGAKVGEIIQGNLARGQGGQFVSADQMESTVLGKILDKIRNRRGDRLGAAQQKRLENRQAAADALGDALPGGVATLDGLAAIRSGTAPDNPGALIDRGLAKYNPDGSVSMTSQGNALLGAANAGDPDRARKVLEGKPKKGPAAKKTPEQIEAEKAAERAENRSEIAGQLPDELAVEDFNALNKFAEGGDLDGQAAKRLAESGLIEYDTDGNARLTSAGRGVSRASGRGDARSTLDALSRGRDRAQAARDKIDEANTRADDIDDQADEAQTALADFEEATEAQASSLEQQLEGAQAIGEVEPQEVARITARVESLRASIERRRERVARMRERAGSQRERAAELQARLGGTENKAKALHVKQDEDEPPPREDFEDQLEDAVRPVLRKYRRKVRREIQRGNEPNTEEMRNELIDALVPVLIVAALSSVSHFEEQFQLFLSDEDMLRQVTRWAGRHAEQQANLMMQTTDGLIEDAQQELDDPQRAREIAGQAFTDERAERIGITEATIALAVGALLFQSAVRTRHGVEIELIWFTREDERVCPVCEPLHETTQEVWSRQFPEGPPAHVRCRCGVTARRR